MTPNMLPKRQHFVISNWFAWILQARDAGYSRADLLFVLKTVGVLEQMRAILAKESEDVDGE